MWGNLKKIGISALLGLSFFAAHPQSSYAVTDLHYAYTCGDYGNGYTTQGTPGYDDYGAPIDYCSCTDASTTTTTGMGPGGVCSVSVNNPGYNGTYYDSHNQEAMCNCQQLYGSYGYGFNATTASDCVAGEIFQNGYGCIPAAACTTDTTPPQTTYVGGSTNSGAHTQTQTYSIGYFITGDIFTVGIASTSQSFSAQPGDTAAMLASRIAAYYNNHALNAYSCGSGPGNSTASSSGPAVTITHNSCHGSWGLYGSRTSPTCSPTPTPTPAAPGPMDFTSGSYTVNGGAPTPSATPPNPLPVLVGGSTSAQTLHLGQIAVSSTTSYATPKILVFSNGSPSDKGTGCSLSSGSDAADFTYSTSGTCSGTLAPGQSCSVSVYGRPATTNSHLNTFTFQCTGPDMALATQQGTVDETGQTIPALIISPATADMGTVKYGTTPPVSTHVTVTNNGSFGATSCSAPVVTDTAHFSVSGNTCASIAAFGTCSFDVVAVPQATGGPQTFTSGVSISCASIDSPNYNSGNSLSAPYFASTASNAYQFKIPPPCPNPGEYDPLNDGHCQCPVGYTLTATNSEGQACRPVLPSLEFYTAIDANSDGFPVCGLNRIPTDSTLQTYSTSSKYTPMSNSTASNSTVSPNYIYKYATEGGASVVNPVYVYKDYERCVCSSQNTFNPSMQSAKGTPLAPTDAAFTASHGNRFVPDTFEQVSSLTADNTLDVDISEVALSKDGVSNAYIGTTFNGANAACGCPNVNEIASGIDLGNNGLAGTVCKSMLNTADATTKKYKLLSTYNPLIHVDTGASRQKFSSDPTVATVKLPSATTPGSYTTYKRRIWTCAPPFEPNFASNQITCVFKPAKHTCDDGTASGTPSVVSRNVGGTTPALQFQNTVNKRLACCLNEFDPNNPSAPQKFDCVDNSKNAYADFDSLWKESLEGQPNAVALTNSSGQLMTGFYSLNGTRCSEFSEFAGAIQSAKVNQQIVSGQQNLANNSASLTAIDNTGSFTIPQPGFVSADPKWSSFVSGKRIPATAADMRRCPILVRAAIKTTCPNSGSGANPSVASGDSFPQEPTTSPLQTYNDPTTGVRCSVASQVDIYLRVEQIYEIAGMAKMKTIDSVSDSSQAVALPVSDMIKSKTAGNCPAGSILMPDGSCVFQ